MKPQNVDQTKPHRQLALGLSCLCFLACAAASDPSQTPPAQFPSVTVSHAIAEGSTGKPPTPATTNSQAPEQSPVVRVPSLGFLPDPPPVMSAHQLHYLVSYRKGQLGVDSIAEAHLDEPRETPRLMGRFALELWRGGALLERVRFDFPLLGGPLESDKRTGGVSLESGLETQRKVWVPMLPEATRAQLVDRKTAEVVLLTWPPPGIQISAD